MKSLPSCLLTGALALACVPGISAEEALPMTDPLVSAFFRFDTPGNSNTSGPWRDSYPGCNAVLNTLSHTKNSAGYTTGDGKAAAPCLNLPYGASSGLFTKTYSTPCKATGTLSKNIPNLSDPSNGWTVGMWVKIDSEHTLASKPDVTASGLGALAGLLTVDSLMDLAGDYLGEYQSLVDLFKSDAWNFVVLTFNPDYPTTNNAYRLYLNIGNSAVTDAQRADMHGGTQKGVMPYTLPMSISGTTLTLGGQIGATLDEPVELEGLGAVSGLKVDCFGKIDDLMIINRCLTSNEVVRLGGKAETYIFLTQDDAAGKYSFSANHNWSSTASNYANHAPEANRDYLVDEARTLRTATSGDFTFGGTSLTLGRVGGSAGNLYQLTPGTVTVNDFRVNNGTIRVGANGTLAGTVKYNAAAAAPLTICSDGSDRSYTWTANFTDAPATDLRAAAGSGSLDMRYSFTGSTFQGRLVADGAATTLRVAPSTFTSLGRQQADAVLLQNSAVLAPLADGDALDSATVGIAADGTGYINVPAGQTFTLATQVSGTIVKTGAGTLILDVPSGSGKVGINEGTMYVTPEAAMYVGPVNGGRLKVQTDENAYGSMELAGVQIATDATLVFDVNDATGAHDAMTIDADSGATWPIKLEIEGTVAHTNSFALFTIPTSVRTVTPEDFDLTVSVGGSLVSDLRIETAGGVQTVWVDVEMCERYVIDSDTFENYAVGTATDSLSNWSGAGEVKEGVPLIPDPPSYQSPDIAHTKTLSIEEGATRTYPTNFAGDNQTLDVLVQVSRCPPDELPDVSGIADDRQVAVTVDGEGHLCIYHPGADGTPVLTPLYFGTKSTFSNGEWVRVMMVFDYHSNPSGDAYVQIRANGSCGVSAEGVRSPTDLTPNGSWFKLFPQAAAAKKVQALDVKGDLELDDVIVSGYRPTLAPEFYTGTVASTNYTGTMPDGRAVSGVIPYALFDSKGVPRDPNGDSDGDGYTDGVELLKHTNPLDPNSNSAKTMVIYFR